MPETGLPEATDQDALYDVVPEQFVAVRDALARRLRSGGDKVEAARVAKLRRPPLTAWALNQVARTDPALVETLLAAGGDLRSAMERALGGDASALRPARAGERSAVDAVIAQAAGRLEGGGYSPSDVMHQRMAATLRAAIVDDSVAAQLRAGTLDGDREAPGFGLDGLSESLARPAAASGDRPQPDAAPAQPLDEEDRQAKARRRQEAHEEADRLTTEADQLVAEADRLAAKGARLAAQASEAMERATAARHRADVAVLAAAAQRAQADQLG